MTNVTQIQRKALSIKHGPYTFLMHELLKNNADAQKLIGRHLRENVNTHVQANYQSGEVEYCSDKDRLKSICKLHGTS